jgi:hypothetical protein
MELDINIGIHKFPIQVSEYQEITMPGLIDVLSMGVQREVICLWAECFIDGEPRKAKIAVRPTGSCAPKEYKKFLGTAMLQGGSLVLHIYQL